MNLLVACRRWFGRHVALDEPARGELHDNDEWERMVSVDGSVVLRHRCCGELVREAGVLEHLAEKHGIQRCVGTVRLLEDGSFEVNLLRDFSLSQSQVTGLLRLVRDGLNDMAERRAVAAILARTTDARVH